MATVLSTQVSPVYPNRIVLFLGPLVGPVYSNALGQFDPRRDVTVFVNGLLATVQSSNFDPGNNRYLLFMTQPIDMTGEVQVIHHMPLSPFHTRLTTGFGVGFGMSFAS